MKTPWTRRRALTSLAWMGAGGALLWIGRPPGDARGAPAAPGCVVRPQQTEGPYFVDERLNRSDLRSDPADGTRKPGVPLRLDFRVASRAAGTCAPLAGATVDLWHCDAAGIYSDVADPGFDAKGKKFLRGYQATDAAGAASFTTIYPGWYPGRAVHVHFKIRQPSRGDVEFTSQLYFDDALSDRVLAREPYTSGRRRTRNADDGIFAEGGEELLLALVPDGEGYSAKVDVALS